MRDSEFHLSDALLGAFLMLTLVMLGADPVAAFGSLLLSAILAVLLVEMVRRRKK